jgi:hypothetical protein
LEGSRRVDIKKNKRKNTMSNKKERKNYTKRDYENTDGYGMENKGKLLFALKDTGVNKMSGHELQV